MCLGHESAGYVHSGKSPALSSSLRNRSHLFEMIKSLQYATIHYYFVIL
jgi:hypothetical protein